jgi:hypothetical protein
MKLHALLALLILALAAACSSPKPAAAEPADKDPRANRSEAISDEDWNKLKPPRPHGEPQAVRFTDYRSSIHLGLVNESHSDPTELYSQRRKLEESMTKVAQDEFVAALLERFEGHGFYKVAEKGPAPAAGAGALTMALEVERQSGLFHLVLGAGSSAKQREVFGLCRTDFATLYNGILGLQSVNKAPDWNSQQLPGTPPKH